LNSLPPELRAEILEDERRRAEIATLAEEAAQNNQAQPAEMDIATFIQTL
jgi:hypothetical protein